MNKVLSPSPVNVGDRYYQYDANGNIVCEQDGAFDGEEPVTYHKITQEAENVYSTDYGWGLLKEKSSGRTTTSSNKYRRTYTWDERNQLISSVDSNYSVSYVYGQDGQRSNKYTDSSETLYFNKMWTLHTDSGNIVDGGQYAKNIYLGDTRIVTKLKGAKETTTHEETYKQYFYHSDHLGSATLITDYKGDEYQRIEYTPYGETWVEKTQNTGLEYLPYKFTGKEIDEETGLYYFGARYLCSSVSSIILLRRNRSDMAGRISAYRSEEATFIVLPETFPITFSARNMRVGRILLSMASGSSRKRYSSFIFAARSRTASFN